MTFDISKQLTELARLNGVVIPDITAPSPPPTSAQIISALISKPDRPAGLSKPSDTTPDLVFSVIQSLVASGTRVSPARYLSRALNANLLELSFSVFTQAVQLFGYDNVKSLPVYTLNTQKFTRWAIDQNLSPENIVSGWANLCNLSRIPNKLVFEAFPAGTVMKPETEYRPPASDTYQPISTRALEGLIERGTAAALVSFAHATPEQLARIGCWEYIFLNPKIMDAIPELVANEVANSLRKPLPYQLPTQTSLISSHAYGILLDTKVLSATDLDRTLTRLLTTKDGTWQGSRTVMMCYLNGQTLNPVTPDAIVTLTTVGALASEILQVIIGRTDLAASTMTSLLTAIRQCLLDEKGLPANLRTAIASGHYLYADSHSDVIFQALSDAFGDNAELWKRFAGDSKVFDNLNHSLTTAVEIYKQRWAAADARTN